VSRVAYTLYRSLYRRLPPGWFRAIGASPILRSLRDRVLRPEGTPAIATGEVVFERARFSFSAPYRLLAQAQSRGIEASMCRFILRSMPHGAHAIDIGASYGFITCVLASNGANVLAIEQSPAIARVLAINATRVGARVLAIGVGDGGAGTTGLDDLRPLAPHVIKIDTDGTEIAILRGAIELIRVHRPLLIVEANGKQSEIIELLRPLGYSRFTDVAGGLPYSASNIVASPA